MEYRKDNSSSTSLSFCIAIPAGDVDAMLASARKRKLPVPAEEAALSMIANGAIEHILEKENFIPLFRPSAELPELKEHAPYEFRLVFDVVPEHIVLPADLGAQSVEVPAPELAYAEAVRFVEKLKQRHGQTDEEKLAAALGFKKFDDLWKAVFEKVTSLCFQRFRAEAQSRLLASLMQGQRFEVPERLVSFFLEELLQETLWQMKKEGKEPAAEEMETLKMQGRELAEENARAHCFLLALARREGIALTQKDLDEAMEKMAAQSSVPLKKMKEQLEAGQGMELLRQRLETNKALALLYDKAQKIVVDAEGRPVEAPSRD